MSAPPIGMMISTPSRNAIAVITMYGIHFDSSGDRKNQMPKPIIAIASARFSMCWPANTTGALRILPDSLPKAMTEPENVIAPMNVPMKSSSRLPDGIGTWSPNAAGSWIAEIAISTAASPTSEWNAATSSGICVICTRRAMIAPMMPPTAIPPRIIPTLRVCE